MSGASWDNGKSMEPESENVKQVPALLILVTLDWGHSVTWKLFWSQVVVERIKEQVIP